MSFFPEEVYAGTVARAHSLGLAVYSGTVSSAPTARRSVDLGLDAIIADNPLACFAFLTSNEEEALTAR